MRSVVVFLAIAVCLSFGDLGCATLPPPRNVARAMGRAADYYPLAIGNTWNYVVQTTPEAPEAHREVKVISQDDKGYFLDSAGARLKPHIDGVTDGRRFLIQDPLELNHSWIAIPAPGNVERYRIVAVEEKVDVPAGHFAGCVIVESRQNVIEPNTGRSGELIVAWTFAPKVGMVRMVQQIASGDAASHQLLEMKLEKFSAGSATAGPAGEKPPEADAQKASR